MSDVSSVTSSSETLTWMKFNTNSSVTNFSMNLFILYIKTVKNTWSVSVIHTDVCRVYLTLNIRGWIWYYFWFHSETTHFPTMYQERTYDVTSTPAPARRRLECWENEFLPHRNKPRTPTVLSLHKYNSFKWFRFKIFYYFNHMPCAFAVQCSLKFHREWFIFQ